MNLNNRKLGLGMVLAGNEAPPVVFTVEQAARRLAVSKTTIWRMLHRRDLALVRIGRSVRVLARSVVELAERGGVSHGK